MLIFQGQFFQQYALGHPTESLSWHRPRGAASRAKSNNGLMLRASTSQPFNKALRSQHAAAAQIPPNGSRTRTDTEPGARGERTLIKI